MILQGVEFGWKEVTFSVAGVIVLLNQIPVFLAKIQPLLGKKNGNGNGKPDAAGQMPLTFWLDFFQNNQNALIAALESNRTATSDAISSAMKPVADGFARMENAMDDIHTIAIYLKARAELEQQPFRGHERRSAAGS